MNVGDVFVHKLLSDFDVEWAVLARRPPDRLLVVAADGQPLVGSADVSVPASEPGGPLVLRCRFGGWIDAGSVRSAIRTDTLASGAVARARALRAEVERAASLEGRGEDTAVVAGSVIGLEIDDDTEYRSWVRETLKPAWETLAGVGRESTEDGPQPQSAQPRSAQPRSAQSRRRRPAPRLLALAAMAALSLGATLFWRQHRELLGERAEALRRQREAAQLLREHEQLKDEFRRRSDEEGADRERLEADFRGRLDELARRLDSALGENVVRNPLVISLDAPSNRRGRPERLRLDPGASHMILAVTLEVPAPGREYRAELLSRGESEPTWTGSGFREDHLGLWIGLPTALLPPGEYLLRIFALGEDGGAEVAAEYPLEVSGP